MGDVGGRCLGGTLEITITDANTVAVVLECENPRGTYKAVVRDGRASFDEKLSDCDVNFVRKSGRIAEPGLWTCGLAGCNQTDVHHAPIEDAPGRINVVMTTPPPTSTSLELTCADGTRDRAPLLDNTGIFYGVSEKDCTLNFKGGAPVRFRPISEGTWYCNLTGSTVLCTQR